MDNLKSWKSVKRGGQFQLFSVLSIGHTQLPGFQRLISRPCPAKRNGGSNRQDLVFVRPPDAGKNFRVSINTVWYCRVLLLFSFYTRTDSGIKRHNCAYVSVLWDYDKDPPVLTYAEFVSVYLIILILEILHRVAPGLPFPHHLWESTW